MQAESAMRYNLTSVRWLLSKRQDTARIGKDANKRRPWCAVGGSVNWYSHFREQDEGSPEISE